jgi:hypothetical protein
VIAAATCAFWNTIRLPWLIGLYSPLNTNAIVAVADTFTSLRSTSIQSWVLLTHICW